jgi:hypothetical protein
MKIVAWALAVSALATCVACNAPPASGDPQTKVAVSTTVRPAIAWPPASQIDRRALDELGGPDRVAGSPVPVLVPSSVRLESATLVVEGEFYSLTGRANGAKITIQGTRAAKTYEHIPPAAGNRDLTRARGFVSMNEGIRTASWIENGAAYAVDVECADLEDSRCAAEGFITALVARLAYVGGAGR